MGSCLKREVSLSGGRGEDRTDPSRRPFLLGPPKRARGASSHHRTICTAQRRKSSQNSHLLLSLFPEAYRSNPYDKNVYICMCEEHMVCDHHTTIATNTQPGE